MSVENATKVIVIGAGIGGLTSATLLAQAGYAVTVLEAQTYAGGCASTFYSKGYRFESGATVVGGFQPNGPHAIVGDMLDLDWQIHKHDPAWVTHIPDRSIALTANNDDVIAKFPDTAKFWQQQSKIADLGWKLSAQGLPFPARDMAEVWQLIKVGLSNFPQDLRLIPFAFSTVYDWLKWHGLHTNQAFVRFLDAQLLISAQTTTKHVNALYGATALDLARQGVFHVEGGIGGIAETLVEKLESLNGRIEYRRRVTDVVVKNGEVIGVYAKKGRHTKTRDFYPADVVIANTTPWNLNQLLGENSPTRLQREVKKRDLGWGAFVLHLGVKADALPNDLPDHHQIITQMHGELGEGRSIFISMSPQWDKSRAPDGERTVTITTHTNVQQWWDLLESDESAYYAKKDAYTENLINTIDTIIDGFKDAITLVMAGTPVTYNFYTNRHKGMVGGFPQTSLFKMRSPRTGIKNLRLVGDSIFPGQSTAGVTLGAIRVAKDIQRNIPLSKSKHPTKVVTDTAHRDPKTILEPMV